MNEFDISEKTERGIGQRGADKEPREFNPKSLLNLKQFQKPTSEANSSVSSDISWSKVVAIVVFLVGIGLIIWKIRNRKKVD